MSLKDRVSKRALGLLREVVQDWKLSYAEGGPMVQALEREFEKIQGQPGLAVANCTIGLEMALRATVPVGANVLVPANGMAADGLAVINAGANVVFCDVDPIRGVSTPEQVEKALIRGIEAVLMVHIACVHPWGSDIRLLCKEHNVRLIEDCAHVMGHPTAGKLGDVGVFSMFATKVLPAGEGGILVGSEVLMERLRMGRLHGREGEWGPCVVPGTNGKMSEMNAAFGVAVMEHAWEIIGRRSRACSLYSKRFGGRGWFGTPGYKYVLNIPDEKKRIALKSLGCTTGPVFGTPLSDQPMFEGCPTIGRTDGVMEGARRFCEEHVCLKTDVTVQEANQIARHVLGVMGGGG